MSAKRATKKGSTPRAAKSTAQEFTYGALKFSQRHESEEAPAFVLFHAPAGEIAKWADVDRLTSNNRTGAQRQLRPIKVSKVKRFLASNEANTIPTSVIVALDSSKATVTGLVGARDGTSNLKIKMPGNKRPGLIIDGQHRVFGAIDFDPSIRLSVIGILGGDDAERAFQFIVINNTPTRVSKDHIKALNLNYDIERLNDRLVDSAGLTLGMREDAYEVLQIIDRSETFKGMLALPTNTNGFIPPNAVEGAFAELQQRRTLLGIEEYELDVFLVIWSEIKSIYKGAWSKNSKLLNKVSIYALTVFISVGLVHMLKADEYPDLLDEEQLRKAVRQTMKHVPIEFWTTTWIGRELDTSMGRRLVLDALDFIEANGRRDKPWFTDVSIVDAALVSGPINKATKRVGKARKTLKKRAVKASPMKS